MKSDSYDFNISDPISLFLILVELKMKIVLDPELTSKPEKAFSPHGTAVGLQMGANAETLVYFPGFFR